MSRLWVVRQKVHDAPRLLLVVLGVGLEGVHHIRELHAIPNKKNGHIVAHLRVVMVVSVFACACACVLKCMPVSECKCVYTCVYVMPPHLKETGELLPLFCTGTAIHQMYWNRLGIEGTLLDFHQVKHTSP